MMKSLSSSFFVFIISFSLFSRINFSCIKSREFASACMGWRLALAHFSCSSLCLNIYSTTISRTFKSVTNSSTFESATIFFQKNKYGSKCLKFLKSSSRTFKSTTISRTFECSGPLLTLVLYLLTISFHLVIRCRPSVQIHLDIFRPD